jgi:hypothetical protein
MTVALADLAYTETYNDGEILDEGDLDSAFESLQTYINTSIKDNLVQFAKDSFGEAAYTFNDDGLASRTNTLFDKQYSEVKYVAGDLDIGTTVDGAYGAVDAVNAAMAFTPEVAGKYRVTFTFTHTFTLTATTEGTCETLFKLTDGTADSGTARSGGYFPAVAANSVRVAAPITITKIFNWTDTVAKSVSLQKRVIAATNVSSNYMSATAATGELTMSVEKI